ncbi:hypothetical protein MHK71_10120 [Kocuria indica]|uniref:hypothetical protein n=1 Tax=Kocuria marina TaxID=223184 RepID=UPI001EF53E6D|nr:hypothetical protein [Kocuria indica]
MAPETFVDFTAPNGLSSWYHVWDSGTAGIMYYFDGDYWDLDDTSINWPDEGDLARLAVAARARDLMFVAVNTPDEDGSGDGYTWWEDCKANGKYFRALHEHLVERNPQVDASNIWLVGYSGGAEFITYELLDRGIPGMTHGGAVIIGGGGANAPVATKKKARPCIGNTAMHWWVGDQDVDGATNPPEWSALGAAEEGLAAFQAAGFDTNLHVLPGVDHSGYDAVACLSHALPAVSRKAGLRAALSDGWVRLTRDT